MRFGPSKHGGLASVCSSIRKHTITPSEHRLSHVNDQPLGVFLPVADSASPNTGLSASIASLTTPFRLTFKRRFDAATTHPKALRIFLDGGARSRDQLAAIGFQIRRGPFDNYCAVYPSETDGVLVAQGEYKVKYPAKDETDNVECELSAAATALFRLFELGEARADVYTDCVAVVQAAAGQSATVRPHLAILGARLRAASRHACVANGQLAFRHLLRKYNKIADGLCNKAMDNWATPFVPPALLVNPFPKLAPGREGRVLAPVCRPSQAPPQARPAPPPSLYQPSRARQSNFFLGWIFTTSPTQTFPPSPPSPRRRSALLLDATISSWTT